MELEDILGKIIIFGARSIALGVSCALRILFPQKEILGFMVSSEVGNPKNLDGLSVMEIRKWAEKYILENDAGGHGKSDITVLIGTPENAHTEIISLLEKYGFSHYVCIGWELEEKLMEQYFTKIGRFFPMQRLQDYGQKADYMPGKDRICVFQVKNHMDCELRKPYRMWEWVHTLQAGAADTGLRIAQYADDIGENISKKNKNYCELTALYWMWKNLLETERMPYEYCGLFQYRRLLNIGDGDILRMHENQVDVVLPFPTVHEPDIREHHKRYIKEEDWMAMLEALKELQPADATAFRKLSVQPYLYNYNILIARREVLRDYCAWLFPILERIEEISSPRGSQRADRYIGYLGENLLTLYFMHRAGQLKIVHTGRKMLV